MKASAPSPQLNIPADALPVPSTLPKAVNPKHAWTASEDEKLIETVKRLGAERWPLIATHLPGRMGKQCRERWFNHLCPNVIKSEWTAEEDQIIAQGVAELGTKWCEIVKRLPGRTDNAIKNRYNSNKRRELRAANERQQQQEKQEKKLEEQLRDHQLEHLKLDVEPGQKPAALVADSEQEVTPVRSERKTSSRGATSQSKREAGPGSGQGKESVLVDKSRKNGRAQRARRHRGPAAHTAEASLAQKRKRVIELATKLAQGGESDELLMQLKDETRVYAKRVKAEPRCGLGTEEPHLNLEEALDELFSNAGSMSEYSAGESSDSESCQGESHGDRAVADAQLRPMLWRPASRSPNLNLHVDVGDTSGELALELSGEVRILLDGDTIDINILDSPPPSAKLDSPFDAPEQWQESEEDWLSLHRPGVRPDSAPLSPEPQNVLLPILTPSNTKLCGALVDAFLPLGGSDL